MHRVAVLLVFSILTGSLLAGCIQSRDVDVMTAEPARLDLTPAQIQELLTQPLYTVIEREERLVEGADGVQLWVNVFRPRDATGPVPIILVKTPYQALNLAAVLSGCEEVPPHACPYSTFLVDHYVPRGYAVAFSDVRGNHNSGGCIDQSGPKQWEDGYRVIEWLAAQSWSNGKVGMYGASYDGETQISTALLNPPSLVTIVPTASVSNQYEYSFYDGVPYSTGAMGTSAAYLAFSVVPGTHPNAITTYPERLLCQHEVFGAALDMSGDWSTYWEERDYRNLAPGIQASVLQTHGLQDWNVKPNHVDEFFNELTTEKRLIVGQWGHSYPDREDWRFTLHRWFDHYLHGIDTGILEDLPEVLIEDTDGAWRGIDSFPPRHAQNRTWHLSAAGSLDDEAGEAGTLIIHDHPRQVTSIGLPLTNDLSETVTGHPSTLHFKSEPLDAPLHYTGRPIVDLLATTDAERTRWVVHLLDIAPDGETKTINRGYFNTRHIDGLDQPRDLASGETYELAIRMFPQDDVIPAGHRIGIRITNVDDWTQQDTTYAASTLQFGSDGTRLTLPLADAGTAIPSSHLRAGLETVE